jgi:hypothetical protein
VSSHVNSKYVKIFTYECKKSIGPLTLSKDALREEMIPWLIKCSEKRNFSDVEYFNNEYV